MSIYAFEGLIPVVHPNAYVHPSAVLIGDDYRCRCLYRSICITQRDYGRLIVETGANFKTVVSCTVIPIWIPLLEKMGILTRRNSPVVLSGDSLVVWIGDYGWCSDWRRKYCCRDELCESRLSATTSANADWQPCKHVRDITDTTWNGSVWTREYQDLAVRCRQSLVETTPLTAPEPNRPRLRAQQM